jgi:diguanylate cyclase (GGDEF)-like protein/PAS domain S-box-containing protein
MALEPQSTPRSVEGILSAITDITHQINTLSSVDSVLTLATDHVRSQLHTDRVVVYRFLPDGDAVIAAESVGADWRPLLGELIYDPCFNADWVEQYRQGRISVIEDVYASHIQTCHREMLTGLQVQANLVVPIVVARSLWALLIAHQCSAVRQWRSLDRLLMQQVADLIGLTVQLRQDQKPSEAAARSREKPSWQLATQVLQEYESYFQQLANHIDQFLFVRDAATGKYLYLSPAYERIWQRSREELYDNPTAWLDAVHPEDWLRVVTSLEQQQQLQSPVTREYRILRPDGEVRWIHAEIFPARDASGKLVRFVGWAEDYTHRELVSQKLQTAQGELKSVLNSAVAAISYFRLYADQHVEIDYRSQGCEAVFGFTADELTHEVWAAHVFPEDWAISIAAAADTLFTETSVTVEYRFRHKDGTLRWISETLSSHRDDQADCWKVTVVAIDISDKKQAELALTQQAHQEALLRQMTDHIRESLDLETILATAVTEVQKTLQADRVAIFHLNLDGSGEVIQEAVLPEYPSILHQPWGDECFPAACYAYYLEGQPRIVERMDIEEWGDCLLDFPQAATVKSKVSAPIVQRSASGDRRLWGLLIAHACGDYRQWQPREADLMQQLADQLAIAIQQSELYRKLQQANRELEQISTTDALTGLANRRRFDHYLRQEWHRLAREAAPITLILADVDHFKLYNDTYGHSAGDTCLARVAQVIQRCARRPGDLAARYGGEEFAIVLPRTVTVGAIQMIERIRQSLTRLQIDHATSPVDSHITLSFGIACVRAQPDDGPLSLINLADQALYKAKARGRNGYYLSQTMPDNCP